MTRLRPGATLLARNTPHRFAFVIWAVIGVAGVGLGGEARAMELRGTHLDEQSLSLIAYDNIQREGDIAISTTLMFFAKSNYSYMEEGVDYVTVQAQYNCTIPGKWRGNQMQAFQIGQGLIAQDDEPTEWDLAEEGSIGHKNWEGVCKGLSPDTIYPTFSGALDNVALGYRAYLKERRKQAETTAGR